LKPCSEVDYEGRGENTTKFSFPGRSSWAGHGKTIAEKATYQNDITEKP
jgi:hypothetical protein